MSCIAVAAGGAVASGALGSSLAGIGLATPVGAAVGLGMLLFG